MTQTVTIAQARRIALAAQGFGRPRPATVGTRQLAGLAEHLEVVQIDSVNVVARSHYLPFFSRLGAYDPVLLDRLRDGPGPRSRAPRRLVEYWAHEAALVPAATWPFLGFRMARPRTREWRASLEERHPGLLDAVLGVVTEHGPLTARGVEQHLPHGAERPTGHWGWNWSAVKTCLECLFDTGELSSAARTAQFERRYAVPELVLGSEVVAERDRLQEQDPLVAVTELLRRSVRAHGIGTQRCLADYFRLRGSLVGRALRSLLDTGELEEVQVPGWARKVYLDPAARLPRAVRGAALLSPFDSLVWQRERVEALWGMRYRLEIYVPQAQRVHGYYVLPFLLDEQLVARVVLKADREAGILRVRRLTREPGNDASSAQVLHRLVDELETMAAWLGLRRVDLPVG